MRAYILKCKQWIEVVYAVKAVQIVSVLPLSLMALFSIENDNARKLNKSKYWCSVGGEDANV